MSDLREALDSIDPEDLFQSDLPDDTLDAVWKSITAARRFLALTETGPDYEAAAKQWEAEFPCVCGPEYTDRGLVAPNCEHHYAKDGSRAIVDAALADYLTEEDR